MIISCFNRVCPLFKLPRNCASACINLGACTCLYRAVFIWLLVFATKLLAMIFLALSEWIELNLFTHAFGDSVCFIHRTATATHTIIIAQPESFTHSFSDENFYFFTHSLFYDVFRSCLCTLHSFNFDDVLFFIFKLSFIDNVRKDLLLGWWFMFDYRYRRWIFFFSHLLIFVRQSWFNTTSEWSSGFKFDDFLLYGTSINHILFEAIRDHPLKIPYQWLFKRNILQPLSSEFYGSLKWKKKCIEKVLNCQMW